MFRHVSCQRMLEITLAETAKIDFAQGPSNSSNMSIVEGFLEYLPEIAIGEGCPRCFIISVVKGISNSWLKPRRMILMAVLILQTHRILRRRVSTGSRGMRSRMTQDQAQVAIPR